MIISKSAHGGPYSVVVFANPLGGYPDVVLLTQKSRRNGKTAGKYSVDATFWLTRTEIAKLAELFPEVKS